MSIWTVKKKTTTLLTAKQNHYNVNNIVMLRWGNKVELTFENELNNLSIFNNQQDLSVITAAYVQDNPAMGRSVVVLPQTVKSIETEAFKWQLGIKSLIIPSSVERIGKRAFDGCSGLESITIPQSVSRIEAGTFRGCTKLAEISMPKSINYIGEAAFHSCSALKKVAIPTGVEVIGEETFANCNNFFQVDIPDSISRIGRMAFYNCKNLCEIILPKTVSTIHDGAFYHCESLAYIVLPKKFCAENRRLQMGLSSQTKCLHHDEIDLFLKNTIGIEGCYAIAQKLKLYLVCTEKNLERGNLNGLEDCLVSDVIKVLHQRETWRIDSISEFIRAVLQPKEQSSSANLFSPAVELVSQLQPRSTKQISPCVLSYLTWGDVQNIRDGAMTNECRLERASWFHRNIQPSQISSAVSRWIYG